MTKTNPVPVAAASRMKTSTKDMRYVILTSDGYGLFAGYLESHDVVTRVAVLREGRSVRYWCGRYGGTTSLAAYGLCGPRAAEWANPALRGIAPYPRSDQPCCLLGHGKSGHESDVFKTYFRHC